MMKLFNNSDIANYYKEITQQRFIYCNDCWYGYDEYNVISKLSKNIPSQLVSNISEVLQKKLKEEIKKTIYITKNNFSKKKTCIQ